MKKREAYLDIVKGISILLIMSVHLPSDLQIVHSGTAFMVPVFFVVSGILMQKSSSKCNIEFWIKKRCKRLIKSYFGLSMASIFIRGVVSYIRGDFSILNIGSLIYQMCSGLGILTLWFLPALMIAEIIVLVANKYAGECFNVITVTLFGAFTIIASWRLCICGIFGDAHYDLDNIFISISENILIVAFEGLMGAFFVGVGFLMTPLLDKARKWNEEKSGDFKFMCVAIILEVINVVALRDMSSDIHYMKISEPLEYMISVSMGIGAVFCCALSIEKTKFGALFTYFGKKSLLIMGTHHSWMLTDLCAFIAFKEIMKVVSNQKILAGITYVLLVALEILLIKIMEILKIDKALGCK